MKILLCVIVVELAIVIYALNWISNHAAKIVEGIKGLNLHKNNP